MTIYEEHGYTSRKDYLQSLAADYCVPASVVFTLASVLGLSEDFDGLVTEIQDAADSSDFDEE